MAGDASWRVELRGVSTLNKALRVLQEPDAPILRGALEKAGRMLQGAAASRAPGGIGRKTGFTGVRGSKAGLRAAVTINHPGGRSMEFGRVWYYRRFSQEGGAKRAANIMKFLDYSHDDRLRRSAVKNLLAIGAGIGNNRPGSKRAKGSMKRQWRFRVPEGEGQRARPYLGVIKGDAAIGAVKDEVEDLLTKAIRDEWDRITGQSYAGAD